MRSRAAIDREKALLEVLLRHPHRNILVVYGVCVDASSDAGMQLVMAYCPGGSLEHYLEGIRGSGQVRVVAVTYAVVVIVICVSCHL